MEEIPLGLAPIIRIRQVGMVRSPPLEEHLPGLQVNLLEDTVQHHAPARPAKRLEVPPDGVVRRHQRRAVARELKLVQVVLGPAQPLDVDPVHLVVLAVQDQPVAVTVPVDDGARVKGQVGLVEVLLYADVARAVVRAVHVHDAQVPGVEDKGRGVVEVVPDKDVRAARGRDLVLVPDIDLHQGGDDVRVGDERLDGLFAVREAVVVFVIVL